MVLFQKKTLSKSTISQKIIWPHLLPCCLVALPGILPAPRGIQITCLNSHGPLISLQDRLHAPGSFQSCCPQPWMMSRPSGHRSCSVCFAAAPTMEKLLSLARISALSHSDPGLKGSHCQTGLLCKPGEYSQHRKGQGEGQTPRVPENCGAGMWSPPPKGMAGTTHTRPPPRTVPVPGSCHHCWMQRAWTGEMSPGQRKASPESALLKLLQVTVCVQALLPERISSDAKAGTRSVYSRHPQHTAPWVSESRTFSGLQQFRSCPALLHVLFS